MFAFFDQIGQLIGSVINFIVTIFTNLVNFFRMIMTSCLFLFEVCAALPVPVQAACMAICGAAVIYLIVGR